MPRNGASSTPISNATPTSTLLSVLKKPHWPFKCNASIFDDDVALLLEPSQFVPFPLKDPFATYSIPSRNLNIARKRQPRSSFSDHSEPLVEFPTPPPREQKSNVVLPPIEPLSPIRLWGSGDEDDFEADFRKKREYRSHQVNAAHQLAPIDQERLACACTLQVTQSVVDEQDGSVEEDKDWDQESIFTLYGDRDEWEDFQNQLFFLRPATSWNPSSASNHTFSITTTSSSSNSDMRTLPSQRSFVSTAPSSVHSNACSTLSPSQ
ncbi:uncharacterized protein JCM15063_001999 [Sporobolomyces koalae]|uniref:uncharacterized protein n=1 Tax=Sporobolomyces koalae TaxID=500713 RepID=UPI003179304C